MAIVRVEKGRSQMTKEDFIKTAMARLVVQGNSPRDIAARTMTLATAIWHELQRWILESEEQFEFIAEAAISKPANVVTFVSPFNEIELEAAKRVKIAAECWLEFQRVRLLTLGFRK